MAAIVVLFYLVAVALNVMALRHTRLAHLQFIDGIVLGMTYYITIPMAFILAAGRIGPSFIPISDYLPYEDLATTAVIIGGMAGISILKVVLHFLYRPMQKREILRALRTSPRYQVLLLVGLLALQTLMTILTFTLSGLSSGGAGWMEAGADLQARGTFFVLLPIINNFARTAVFGSLAAIVVWQKYSPLRRWWWAIAGYSVAIDLAFVFNRITVLYFLFLTLIVFRKHAFKAAGIILSFLLFFAQFSSAWTYFRSYVSVHGYSVDSLTEATARSFEATAADLPFVDRINGAFESINITVLNWVVQYHWRLDMPFGAYLVRPATVLIPRSIWPSRPTVFPAMVGDAIQGRVPLNSTLFAEPYANSPLLWPIMLFGMIVLYDFLFRRMSRQTPSWGVIGAFVGAAWWRFDSSFPATCIIFSAVLASCIGFYVRATSNPARRPRRSRQARGANPSAA